MGLEVLPIGVPSVVSICLIIGVLLFSYFKKWLITYALIITNFVVFIITLIFPYTISELGFRPIFLNIELIPQIYTLFTSMFIHADFLHILGNMFIFYFIGLQFEQRVGWKNFIIIYLLAGICGSLTHAFLNVNSITPLVGASGAIFGIMGAFAFSYPQDKVVMPIPVGFFMIIRRIKVIYAVLIFAGLETVIVFLGAQDNTAHFAHLGGLIGGVILSAVFIKRKFQSQQDIRNPEIITPAQFEVKRKSINFQTLDSLATTIEHKQILERIKQETVPQVQDIWIEHFLEKVNCPKCSSKLNHFNRKIWCDNCQFQDKI